MKLQTEKQKQEALFDLKDLLPIGLTVVVLGIALAYGLDVMDDINEGICDNYWLNGKCLSCSSFNSSYTFNSSSALCVYVNGTNVVVNSGIPNGATNAGNNASADTIKALTKMPEKLELIVTVIVAAVIISIIINYLYLRFR